MFRIDPRYMSKFDKEILDMAVQQGYLKKQELPNGRWYYQKTDKYIPFSFRYKSDKK